MLDRRSFVATLNSRFVYGKIPLLHTIVFFIEMALLSKLVSRYNVWYGHRPILTMMATNALLFGVADTVAQTLTAIRQRALRQPGGVARDDFIAIEIHELDKKNPFLHSELIPASMKLPPPYDFERTARFAAYGLLVATAQYKWITFLNVAFPKTLTSTFIPALKRVALDQLVFAPASLAWFFTFMTLAEGGGKRAIFQKFEDVYLPALRANFMVWPAVQLINFRLVPLQFQLPFVSTIGIFWTAYLSLTNSAEES
ncbi:MAG: hypothetical protein M1829_005966 [Trizodia sp. TS-e1964]|nr:MAG: hypothetical protein M1829_005966 [Trizodia sp. TS-e1964]